MSDASLQLFSQSEAVRSSQKQSVLSVAVRAAALAVTELGGSGQDGGWLGKQQQVWCGTGLVSVIC